jgi:uncharacterized lipoprotein YbaY
MEQTIYETGTSRRIRISSLPNNQYVVIEILQRAVADEPDKVLAKIRVDKTEWKAHTKGIA